MRNFMMMSEYQIKRLENLTIHEFMAHVREPSFHYNGEDGEDNEYFSPLQWAIMIINATPKLYHDQNFIFEKNIAHYLQFMDRLDGENRHDPLYPTTVFESEITSKQVFMGAYNFYYLRITDTEDLIHYYLPV